MDQLAVVIVNWNRYAETARCVADLLAWSSAPEVWVVDNGSSDCSARQLAEQFSGIRVLASRSNLGYGGGNNLALEQIERPYVLLLNNDAGLEESSARVLCSALDNEPALAVIGALIVDAADRERVLSAGGRDIARHVRTNLSAVPTADVGPYEVDYVPGTVAMLRMRALHEVGLLAPEYFFGGELADLASRLQERGWRCAVTPAAQAWHDLSHAAHNRAVLYRYYILRNRFLYIRRRLRGFARAWQLAWLAYGCASMVRFVVRGRFDAARAEALALLDGVAGRYGGQNERIVGRVA